MVRAEMNFFACDTEILVNDFLKLRQNIFKTVW